MCYETVNVNHAGSMSIRGSELAVFVLYVMVLN